MLPAVTTLSLPTVTLAVVLNTPVPSVSKGNNVAPETPKTLMLPAVTFMSGILTIEPAARSPGMILTDPMFPMLTAKSAAVVCQTSTLPN